MAEIVSVARDGARCDVTMRNGQRRNAMSEALQDALAEVLPELAGDPSIGVLVLTGEGEHAFCAGGDLHEFAAYRSESAVRALMLKLRGVLDGVRRFPAPVVAALNGHAIGGGSELALAADFRVAATHARLVFGQVGQAVTPGWGGGADLIDLVGGGAAQRLLATGARLDHAEGLALGLYDAVADDGEPLGAVVERFVAHLLHAPVQVLRANKSIAVAARFRPARPAVEAAEIDAIVSTWLHPDHWARLDAFRNRRG